MFNDKSNISVDVLYDDMKRQQDNMRECWRLYEELRKKVNGLYKKDYHDTERPKVDILSDTVASWESEQWVEINKLKERMCKLENKK